MKRKQTIHDFNAFEIGSLYELQKSCKKTMLDFNEMRFSVNDVNNNESYDVKIGDVVLCLGRTPDCQPEVMATDFLLPNGCVGTISIFNFISVGFFGLKLVKVKAGNKRKESSNA